jgi:hypothetical protein
MRKRSLENPERRINVRFHRPVKLFRRDVGNGLVALLPTCIAYNYVKTSQVARGIGYQLLAETFAKANAASNVRLNGVRKTMSTDLKNLEERHRERVCRRKKTCGRIFANFFTHRIEQSSLPGAQKRTSRSRG